MEKDISISFTKATILGILIPLPLAMFFLALYHHFWGYTEIIAFMKNTAFLFLLLLYVVLGSAFHELVHGLSWSFFAGKPLQTIHFGMHWKSLSPFAHCTESMNARSYRIGCVMPYLLEGLIPSIVSVITGSGWLLFFGLIFTMGAGGDLLILCIIRKLESKTLVRDHPTRVGCSVLIPDDDNRKSPL
ncbi:MAG: DUF3267 domain-containing protein [Bacteroidota bacterium]